MTGPTTMLLDDFADVCLTTWDSYFRSLSQALKEGRLASVDGKIALYPTMLVCTHAGDFHIAEFFGATEEYRGLQLFRRKQSSYAEYIGQFQDIDTSEPLLAYKDCIGMRVSNLTFRHALDIDEARRRFPALGRMGFEVVRVNSSSCLIHLESVRDISFQNTMFVHAQGPIYRGKYILELVVIDKRLTKSQLQTCLTEIIGANMNDNTPAGVIGCDPNETAAYEIAGHLQSLVLTPHLHETTIGQFFNQHPDLIAKAFNASDYRYEPSFPWLIKQEGNTDTAINPDLMIKREDGCFDIVDFKTALLAKKSLTKGERRRRRFIDAVNEGIAQLAHYADFFRVPEHQVYAKDAYGIELDNPGQYL
jgi:hypothetical protein